MASDVTVTPPPSTKPSSTVQPVPLTDPNANKIFIPTYSRWFSLNAIHECETRFVPEFFNVKLTFNKTPQVYKYYRNAIITQFRKNPNRKLTFTDARKLIVGDVGSIRRVFDFLETWGLINYNTCKQLHQLDDNKETKSTGNADVKLLKNMICSGCKSSCTIACFVSDKHWMTLCRKCYYVRCNDREGLSSADFKRVEIGEGAKVGWSDKETLRLLEAVMHYGDDWKIIAKHVGGRSERECVARFMKLPFAERFGEVSECECGEMDTELGVRSLEKPRKRQCLSPLADASNPIMAQAAFLSTLAGVDAAEVAAHAAVTAFSVVQVQESLKAAPPNTVQHSESDNSFNANNLDSMEEALVKVNLQLEKEEEEVENAVSATVNETKEIEEKILHFEELDLQMEKKWRLIKQLQDLLFVDQISLLFPKADASKNVENNRKEALKS